MGSVSFIKSLVSNRIQHKKIVWGCLKNCLNSYVFWSTIKGVTHSPKLIIILQYVYLYCHMLWQFILLLMPSWWMPLFEYYNSYSGQPKYNYNPGLIKAKFWSIKGYSNVNVKKNWIVDVSMQQLNVHRRFKKTVKYSKTFDV